LRTENIFIIFDHTATGKQTLRNSHGSGRRRNLIPLFIFDSGFPHNSNHVFTFPFIERSNSSPLKYYEQVTTTGNEEFCVILIYNENSSGKFNIVVFFECFLPAALNYLSPSVQYSTIKHQAKRFYKTTGFCESVFVIYYIEPGLAKDVIGKVEWIMAR
jgi:hypothetical protein